jgi:hypothetical protein
MRRISRTRIIAAGTVLLVLVGVGWFGGDGTCLSKGQTRILSGGTCSSSPGCCSYIVGAFGDSCTATDPCYGVYGSPAICNSSFYSQNIGGTFEAICETWPDPSCPDRVCYQSALQQCAWHTPCTWLTSPSPAHCALEPDSQPGPFTAYTHCFDMPK